MHFSPSDPLVKRIELALLGIDLDTPVQLGTQTIARRDYVAIRVILSDGAEGFAYGYERGLPLFELALRASAHYIGQPAALRNGLTRKALGPTPAPHAAMSRGVSLCDIALWDAWCIGIGQPLWAALGGTRQNLPVMPVIGYGMTPDRAASEGARLAGRGFSTIKLMIDGTDITSDTRVMEALAQALPEGTKFGIDAHWSWTSLDEALFYGRIAERIGAIFIEDPFAPTRWKLAAELAARLDIPLALGEDVTDLGGFRDLAAGGILRVDASVSGGVGAALEAMAVARLFDRPVIPHVFAGLHLHLGLARDSVRMVEAIMPEIGADPIDRYFLNPLSIENGMAMAPLVPGAGLALDWDRLMSHAVKQESVTT